MPRSDEILFEFYCSLPPGTNEQIKANRSRSGAGKRQKANWTNRIAQIVKGYEPPRFPGAFYIHCHFLIKNPARDRDNAEGSRKFIFDGLKAAGVIVDDNKKLMLDATESYGVGSNEVLVTVSNQPIKFEAVA